MTTPFHFIIDTEEELILQRQYYTDLLSSATDKKQKLLKELSALEAATANCTKMIDRIDRHLEEKGNSGEFRNSPTPTMPTVKTQTIQKPVYPENVTFNANRLFVEDGFTAMNGSMQHKNATDNYEPQLIKVAKAEYALTRIGKEATTREMLTLLLQRDPELLKRDNTTFDKFQKALSATLVQKASAQKTFYHTKTNDGVKYGLIAWRNKNPMA